MPDDREQLSIVIERHGHRMTIRLRGELDIVTAPVFADALSHANNEVIVDFADLAFLDASGLGVLADASERVEQDGDQLMVVNATPFAQRLFRISRLDHLLAGTDAPQ